MLYIAIAAIFFLVLVVSYELLSRAAALDMHEPVQPQPTYVPQDPPGTARMPAVASPVVARYASDGIGQGHVDDLDPELEVPVMRPGGYL